MNCSNMEKKDKMKSDMSDGSKAKGNIKKKKQ
jgi:hypothetical protein